MKIRDLPEDMQSLIGQISLDSGYWGERGGYDEGKFLNTDLPMYDVPVEFFPPPSGRDDPYDERKYAEYIDTPIDEYPPLVVAHDYFIDGNHRLYAALFQRVPEVRTLDASKIILEPFVKRQKFLGKLKAPR